MIYMIIKLLILVLMTNLILITLLNRGMLISPDSDVGYEEPAYYEIIETPPS